MPDLLHTLNVSNVSRGLLSEPVGRPWPLDDLGRECLVSKVRGDGLAITTTSHVCTECLPDHGAH